MTNAKNTLIPCGKYCDPDCAATHLGADFMNETSIQTFAVLADRLGGPEDAENALRNLGVPQEIYQAYYEDFLAKHNAEQYAKEARRHQREHELMIDTD